MSSRSVVIFIVLLALTGVVNAADAAAPRITLSCGGIGQDESARMLALEKSHALTIIFTLRDGSYVADVRLRIDGPVADTSVERECGPIGLVNVSAPGRYRVAASFDGRDLEQWVELKPLGGDRLVLRW